MDPMYSAYNCGYLASPVFVFACVTLPLGAFFAARKLLSTVIVVVEVDANL